MDRPPASRGTHQRLDSIDQDDWTEGGDDANGDDDKEGNNQVTTRYVCVAYIETLGIGTLLVSVSHTHNNYNNMHTHAVTMPMMATKVVR